MEVKGVAMEIECNTSSLEVKERTEVWSEIVRSAFGSVHVQPEQRGQHLFGHLKSSERDMLRFNSLHYRGQSHHRTPADIARLKNEYITLTRPTVGKLHVDYGATQSVLEPNHIYLFNHAVPYYATPQSEYGTSSIAFPASMLRQRGVRLQPTHTLSVSSHQGMLVSRFADHLTSNYLQWNDQEFAVLTEQLLDLITLFFFVPGSTHAQDESSVRAAHLQRALAFINANFGECDLSPLKIAQACGISVSYLHHLFSATETSVEAAVFKERLQKSKLLLMSPQNMHLSIGMIAYMCGFTHPAHFSRIFRQSFGCTPREFRGANRVGP
jgi:AraC-like DNA-binding protein